MNKFNDVKVFKIILIGDGYVGKTTLRRQYMGESLQNDYLMTIGAEFSVKEYKKNHDVIALQIWDLAGQPQFNFIRNRYYENTSAVILMFDLTNQNSFNNLHNWITEFLKANNKNEIPLVLIGNKRDLLKVAEKQVTEKEIKIASDKINLIGKDQNVNFLISYFETSAKTGYNVEEVFNKLISLLNQ